MHGYREFIGTVEVYGHPLRPSEHEPMCCLKNYLLPSSRLYNELLIPPHIIFFLPFFWPADLNLTSTNVPFWVSTSVLIISKTALRKASSVLFTKQLTLPLHLKKRKDLSRHDPNTYHWWVFRHQTSILSSKNKSSLTVWLLVDK